MSTGASIETIEFLSEGHTLRGKVFRPDTLLAEPAPAVALAHGWGMTAGGNLEDFANAFASAGFIAMTFDFRNLGLSDGEPRQDLDPYDQIEDFRNAVAYLGTVPGVDPERLGIWGSSYSGGHVLVLGAIEPLVKCIVSQVPTIDGSRAAQMTVSARILIKQQEMFTQDRLRVLAGESPEMVKSVTDEPGEWVVFPGREAFEYMQGDGDRSSTWRNETTLRSLERARLYLPGMYVPRIAPKPLLMIIADNDTTTPTSLQLEAFESALEPKKIKIIKGGHYSPYEEKFEAASSAAAAWFVEHL